jgi:hypothetical protein
VTSLRALRDHITNALDFLSGAELVLYSNSVRMAADRVSWHAPSNAPFFLERGPASPDQYLAWVTGGHYSATLPDGSLLQLTYEVEDGEVTGHRLAYVPCPVVLDERLLWEGEPIADTVRVYLDEPTHSAIALRSPVRVDLDMSAADAGHPAAHLTLNESDCRIACVAPMHPYRFIDFVFRHFYPRLRLSQEDWFREASRSLLGDRVLADEDRAFPHLAWDLHPSLSY